MNYKVTALTPLLVGDGRALSPIDYMVWKDQVNVLDQPTIFKSLRNSRLFDTYLGELRTAKKLDFARWGGYAQQERFSRRRIPFEHAESTGVWNAAPPESLFIPTFASDHRGAYLPASAVKGALRTGLIFSRWSAATMERLAASLEGDRLPRRASEAAEASASASQVRIMSVADSQAVPASAFRIYVTRVASLDTRQPAKPQLVWKVVGRGSVPPQRMTDATPVFTEMAVPGTAFAGEWRELQSFDKQEVLRALGWRSAPKAEALTEAANQYADAQLNLHTRYAEMTGLKGLRQTLEHLKGELSAAQGSPLTCLLSLGWGGGFLSKAAFLDTEQEPYRRILRSVPAIGKAVREGVPFPKTRRVVFVGGQPSSLPGWVKLQFVK
jgi:CRISPR-associated protein Csm5